MWIRKSAEQLAKERGRWWLSFRGPAFLLLFGFGMCLLWVYGPGKYPTHTKTLPPWPQVLCFAVFGGTFAAIGGYVLQIFLRRKIRPWDMGKKVVMCDSCHRVKNLDRENQCECGGTFDNLDNWRWVDDAEEDAE
jgi:hypothetical protein